MLDRYVHVLMRTNRFRMCGDDLIHPFYDIYPPIEYHKSYADGSYLIVGDVWYINVAYCV